MVHVSLNSANTFYKISVLDNNQDKNCHVTLNNFQFFHGSSVKMKDDTIEKKIEDATSDVLLVDRTIIF